MCDNLYSGLPGGDTSSAPQQQGSTLANCQGSTWQLAHLQMGIAESSLQLLIAALMLCDHCYHCISLLDPEHMTVSFSARPVLNSVPGAKKSLETAMHISELYTAPHP